MIPGLFNDPVSSTVRTALGGLQLRQQTIANNVANIDTPNYRAKEVTFEDALIAQLVPPKDGGAKPIKLGLITTDPRHIPVASTIRTLSKNPVVSESIDGTLRNDGNTVDVEREMAKLAETQITYNAVGQVVSAKLTTLRNAINEGRR